MASSSSYTPESFLPAKASHELPRDISSLYHIAGFDTGRHNNIILVEADTILYAAGNAVVKYDLNTKTRKYVLGLDGGGVGCIAMNATMTYLAVGGCGHNPNIFIYSYPEFVIKRVLAGGTERGYASLNFSPDGTLLTSVGQRPDYLLTVWDWDKERITLHTKAFGQDVFKVAFSRDDPGRLTTSGTGHIRFWDMARTFTGLKLQGEIGKFGKIDLSDIEDFVELPDGKVISTSETGYLLLWEGGFVKCRFVTSADKPEKMYKSAGESLIFGDVPAHKGGIFCVAHDREINQIVTAGADGYIRWWSFPTIDVAEVDSDITMDYPLMPISSIFVGEGVCVKCVVPSKADNSILVEDGNGALYKVSTAIVDEPPPPQKVWDFHSGPINGLDASPVDHYCVTGGADGVVRCWDYTEKRVMCSVTNGHACTSVRALPKSIDKDGRTFAVGFSDGVVRCYFRTETNLVLQQVMKPHNTKVLHIEFSQDGKYMATGGEDGTVFFLCCPPADDLTKAYEPVGFVNSPEVGYSSITSLSWRTDNQSVLYSCGNSAVEVSVAEGLKTRSADSFEIVPTQRIFQYKERPVVKMASEDDDAGDEKKDDAVPTGPAPPPKVAYAVYSRTSPESFLLGLKGDKAAKVYECKFGDEYTVGEYLRGVRLSSPTEDGAAASEALPIVSAMGYSSSEKFVLTCSVDGSVTVRPSARKGYFTKYNMHESCYHTGAVGACLSFDDEFMLSAGDDGLLVTWRLNPRDIETAAEKAEEEHRIQEEASLKKIIAMEDSGEGNSKPPEGFDEIVSSSVQGKLVADQVAAAVADVNVEDITEESAYSIQDEKLRKEEDARKLAAERTKEQVREVVRGMQKEYADLVKKNALLPEQQRLSQDELVVDPEFIDMLHEEGEDMIREVRLECARESEKSDLRLTKLNSEFIDVLDYELFYVNGLKNGLRVSSFPTRKLSSKLRQMLYTIHTVMESEESTAARMKNTHAAGKHAGAGDGRGTRPTMMTKSATGLSISYVAKGEKKSAFEIRKELRQKRSELLKDHDGHKPAEDADDPQDIKAIEEAAKNLGDYKIKTAADYEVPEDQRVNAEKKRRQMILLQESIHKIKCNFNKKLIACRDVKSEVVLSIQAYNRRIRIIDEQLSQKERSRDLWEPKLDAWEYPEDRGVFGKSDIDAFQASAKAAGVGKANAPKKSIAAKSLSSNAVALPVSKAATKDISQSSLKLAKTLPVLLEFYDLETAGDMPVMAAGVTPSQIEKDEISEVRTMLLHERQALLTRVESDALKVDEKIYALRKMKMQYNVELKAAEMRLLVLHKELTLLMDFETKDNMLNSKLEKCQRDKGEVVANISNCHGKLQTKKAELQVWVEKDKTIMEDFTALVPEKNNFHDQLLKIFKRKMKRAKKRSTNDDEDEEEEEDDGGDFDDNDDDYEENEVDDSCPPGCDTALYESIIELREKRLDQEEVLADFQKELDELKKAHDRHVGRERQIDKDLKNTEVEIQKFQTEKQQHINELLVNIPLRISQIHLWKQETDAEGNKIDVPKNPTVLRDTFRITGCAVFSDARLEKLRRRIGELNLEIVQDKEIFKGLHKQKSALEKDKVVKEGLIAKQTGRCEELQMLKFGQLVDITALDKISVNNDEAELRVKSNALEISNEQEIFKIHAHHRQLKGQLLDFTHQNTAKLNRVADLNGRQFFLEKELNGNKTGMQVVDDGPTLRAETEERNRLVALVKLQAKEVDALKAEINLLRRKGGHIYAPPPSELPPPPSALDTLLRSESGM